MHTQLLHLVREEKKITTKILELLQKISDERLHLSWGYSSLYDYLTRGLGYSESVAYQRQSVVRIMKDVPEVKGQLEEGNLHFSSLSKAYKVIKKKSLAEKKKIIATLKNKTAREVEQILASENPELTLVSKKRYVNEQTIRITMDVTVKEYEEIQKLRSLKSHKVKNEKDLLVHLVQTALQKYQNIKETLSSSKNPRQIPKLLKNALLQKANYRCQYPGCTETHYLQIDHITPVREQGTNHPQNLQVLCASHNYLKG